MLLCSINFGVVATNTHFLPSNVLQAFVSTLNLQGLARARGSQNIAQCPSSLAASSLLPQTWQICLSSVPSSSPNSAGLGSINTSREFPGNSGKFPFSITNEYMSQSNGGRSVRAQRTNSDHWGTNCRCDFPMLPLMPIRNDGAKPRWLASTNLGRSATQGCSTLRSLAPTLCNFAV